MYYLHTHIRTYIHNISYNKRMWIRGITQETNVYVNICTIFFLVRKSSEFFVQSIIWRCCFLKYFLHFWARKFEEEKNSCARVTVAYFIALGFNVTFRSENTTTCPYEYRYELSPNKILSFCTLRTDISTLIIWYAGSKLSLIWMYVCACMLFIGYHLFSFIQFNNIHTHREYSQSFSFTKVII